MKLFNILQAALIVLGTAEATKFNEKEVSYDKKPQQLQKDFISYHDYLETPFLSNDTYDAFLDSPIDESTGLTYREVSNFNDVIRDSVRQLVNQNFFRIYRLNLYKECPFWKNDGFCMHRSCAVDTLDDWEDLPQSLQPEALGHIENSSLVNDINAKSSCPEENQYCELEGVDDETVYVDLVANPERFTGYGGDQSWQIWKSIYSENCFNLGQDQCLEKNFFYKLISGMHASISTHLSNDHFNKAKKEYEPHLHEFMFRVGDHPDRMQNVYTNYIILLKALIKLDTFGVLDNLQYHDCGSPSDKDDSLKTDLKHILDKAIDLTENKNECMFNENVLFQDEGSELIKGEIKENFKNITRIMDCVHCDRCRLWGKVQTTGYGTALKVLFDLHDKNDFHTDITKIELVALVNTFDRMSKTLHCIQNFRKLYIEAIKKEELGDSTNEDLLDDTLNSFNLLAGSKKEIETPKVFKQTDKKEEEKEEEKEFNDVVFPVIKDEDFQSLKDVFFEELANVFSALKWLASTYIIFPKIVYNWVLIRLVYYWNIFVGHVHEDFDLERLYRIQI